MGVAWAGEVTSKIMPSCAAEVLAAALVLAVPVAGGCTCKRRGGGGSGGLADRTIGNGLMTAPTVGWLLPVLGGLETDTVPAPRVRTLLGGGLHVRFGGGILEGLVVVAVGDLGSGAILA